jgi:predicted nucleic acid-binding protein
MKLFIDTNIFLDLILKREYYKEATQIFNAVSKNIYSGVILDITILNIDYIAKKQVKDIRNFLKVINDNFTIIGASNETIKKALNMSNKDLEDNLQYINAKEYECKVIITNDKSFYSKDIEVLSSVEFIVKFGK